MNAPVLHARGGPSLFYPLLQTTVCEQMFVSERRERSVDATRADTVDLELDRLISRRQDRRQDRRPDPDELEPSYRESVRRHRERICQENAAAWRGHHEHMAEIHSRLASEHAARAAAVAAQGALPSGWGSA